MEGKMYNEIHPPGTCITPPQLVLLKVVLNSTNRFDFDLKDFKNLKASFLS